MKKQDIQSILDSSSSLLSFHKTRWHEGLPVASQWNSQKQDPLSRLQIKPARSRTEKNNPHKHLSRSLFPKIAPAPQSKTSRKKLDLMFNCCKAAQLYSCPLRPWSHSTTPCQSTWQECATWRCASQSHTARDKGRSVCQPMERTCVWVWE